MTCPECDGATSVKDSRKYAGAVYRRRECKECGFKFFTEETELEDIVTIREMWANCKGDQRRKNVRKNKPVK